MKKNIIITVIAILYSINTIAQQSDLPFKLKKDWEVNGFKNPESVVIDKKNKVLYVSNVNGNPTEKDNNGFISKVGLDGNVIDNEWISGLNAPKGLTIYKGKLYATDIDEILEINIADKKITKYHVKDATFLNDITADKKGNIYASNTFGFSGIYLLPRKTKEVKMWMKNDNLKMPNGIYADVKKLYVASWGIGLNPKTFETETLGSFYSIDTDSKVISTIVLNAGNLDGISRTLHGYLMTDWIEGKLVYYSDEKSKLADALDLPKGSADTFFDKKEKAVYIPLMLDNKLLKYSFN